MAAKKSRGKGGDGNGGARGDKQSQVAAHRPGTENSGSVEVERQKAAADALAVTVEDPSLYRGKAGATAFSVPFAQAPAHVSAFDFVTLALALRHLADGKGSVEVGLVAENRSVAPGSPGWLVSAGKLSVSYVEDVSHDGVDCAKYSVVGPALGSEEGLLWLPRDKGAFQDMEIPLANGADWPDLKLSLRSVGKLSEKEWPARRAAEVARVLKK